MRTPNHCLSSWRRLGVTVLLGAVATVGLPGCTDEPTATVAEVKRGFASSAVSPAGAASSLGSITATRFDAATGRLHDVNVTMGDAFFLNAATAELIVDHERDTMMIRFHDVVWTSPTSAVGDGGTEGSANPLLGPGVDSPGAGAGTADGGDGPTLRGAIHEAPVRVSPAWELDIDVVPDALPR